MKSAKWFWGGIGLQLAVGYTVAYLVYTVGTLILSPSELAVVPAIAGLVAILVMALIISYLIIKANKESKSTKTNYNLG